MDEAALPKLDCGDGRLDVADDDAVTHLEVGVPQEVDASNGVSDHLRERVRHPQCDEADGRSEAGGHVAHPEDLQDGQRRSEPQEDTGDRGGQLDDQLLSVGEHPDEDPTENRQHDAYPDVRQQRERDGRDHPRHRRHDVVAQRSRRLLEESG